MKQVYIYSYSKKSKFPNLKNLTSWLNILNNFGCMAVSDIKEAYDKLVDKFTADNLVALLDEIDKHFKDSRWSHIKTVSEIIGKTDYKRITVEYDDNGGDAFVDYFLIDDEMK